MKIPSDLPIISFASQDAWEAWLEEHHATAPGLWLQLAKKGSGHPSVTYDEAVEVALCFGWIDGQKQSYNEEYFLQKFTPRRPRSVWSKVNTQRVQRLIEQGRMRPAGMKHVESAKQDGRWDAAYASGASADVPEDFLTALEAHPAAKAFFATLTKANQYAIYFRIHTARNPELRRTRIEKIVAMLAEGKTFHRQKAREPQS